MSSVTHNICYWGDSIEALANDIGVEVAALHAIAAVEVGAIQSVDDGLPTIRFEVHVCLKRTLKDMSSVIKLENSPPLDAWNKDAQWYYSQSRWVRVHSGAQSDEWAALTAASKVDGEAALESASYGVGQLMGFHWLLLGCESPQAMVAEATEGVPAQLDQWGRFLTNEQDGKLITAMNEHDWEGFTRIYNGSGQVDYYSSRMEQMYNEAVIALESGMTEEDHDQADLSTWEGRQEALVTLGYDPGPVDGAFGPSTKSALQEFQADQGLTPDGIWGPKTEKAMDEALEAASSA